MRKIQDILEYNITHEAVLSSNSRQVNSNFTLITFLLTLLRMSVT